MIPAVVDSGRVMWEGQRELRWSMERLADEALDRAGVELDPRGFLVGLPEEDHDLPIRLEPARRAFDLLALRGLMDRADELFAEQEERDDVPEELRAQDHYREAVMEGCRRQIVVEALTKAARFTGRTVVIGMSVVVGDYRVFPVLAVQTEPWEELPSLASTQVDGLSVDASFQEAIVHDVLRAASRELDRTNPSSLIGVDAGAVLRSAADTFVNGVVARTGQEYPHGLRDALDAVSAQTYEGRASTGSVVLAAKSHEDVAVEVGFARGVPLGVTRSFRRTLEMSGRGLRLLSDGREVHGLGRLLPGYDPADETCFLVRVVGNGSWELWHGGTPYLRVDNGQPALPRELMDRDGFADTVARVFAGHPAVDAEALWAVAEACTQQQYGAMVVVHPDAAAEGERLYPQSQLIEPTPLGSRAFAALTRVDGAVLLSPDGRCHAVGVILDGAATGTGDSSRGARYNSAIRYLAGAGRGSMVIIVSEDGRIDLLPTLMRRVRRSTIEQAVQRLVDAVEQGEDYEKIARLDRQCERLEFYLDDAQCERVNQARETVEQRRWTEERVRLQVTPIQPHPAMDDTYFVEPAEEAQERLGA